MKIIKAVCFIIAGMAAGLGSGYWDITRGGVRGAILGGVLAGGILAWEAYREKKGPLPIVPTLLFAVAVSVAVASLCQAWDVIRFSSNVIWRSSWVSTFLTCLLITSSIFLWYRSFSLRQHWLLGCFFFWGMPSLGGITYQSGSVIRLSFQSFWWQYGLLPFLVFWGIAGFLFAISNRKRMLPKGKTDEFA